MDECYNPEDLKNLSTQQSEEGFLKKLGEMPALCGEEKPGARIRAISKGWKNKVNQAKGQKKKAILFEKYFLLFHLCPRLLEHPEFAWLKEVVYLPNYRIYLDSRTLDAYLEATERIRKRFRPTKPRQPEQPYEILKEVNDYVDLKIQKDKSEMLDELYKISKDEFNEEAISGLAKKAKLGSYYVDDELEWFHQFVEKYYDGDPTAFDLFELLIRGPEDSQLDPADLSELLNPAKGPHFDKPGWERLINVDFWDAVVFQPLIEKEKEYRKEAILDVAKKMGLKVRTVKDHLSNVPKLTLPTPEVLKKWQERNG